jgi:hypothetical protein
MPTTTTTATDEPLTGFADCHAGIVRRLHELNELPGLLGPAARARALAERSLAFFREAIFEHHMDEERELFPAVLASAEPGDERDRVQAMVQRLTQQHRALEALWKSMEKDLRRVAKGHDSDLDTADVHRLVNEYQSHALFEEMDFLPLAQTILGRNGNHMAALGLSLHLRHAPQPVPYV